MSHHGYFKADEYVTCPYNSNHHMLQGRLQSHLVKCMRQYPSAGKKPCPFNSTHIIDVPHMVSHVNSCPDRDILDSFKYTVGSSEGKTDILPVENRHIPCDESWDDVDVPTYDPMARIEQDGRLIVNKRGVPPAERKRFREERRLKYQTIEPTVEAAGTDGPAPSTSTVYVTDYPDECGAEPFEYNPRKKIKLESTATAATATTNYSLAGIGRGAGKSDLKPFLN